MRMDSVKIKSLKKDFKDHGGELTMVQFIDVMMQVILLVETLKHIQYVAFKWL